MDAPGFPLLEPLDERDRAELLALGRQERVPAGTVLFREGEPSDAVFLVEEGRVALSLREPGRDETIVLTVGTGELLGWSGLIDQRRVATARASEACVLLRLPAAELRELCERDHDIGYVLMREAVLELAGRLHDTRLQLLDMFSPKAT